MGTPALPARRQVGSGQCEGLQASPQAVLCLPGQSSVIRKATDSVFSH